MGGGATPLASAMEKCATEAQKCQAHGMNATIILLTDGRANITLDGDHNRKKAMEDVHEMSKRFRAWNTSVIIIDSDCDSCRN